MNILLRYRDTVCVEEYGYLFILYADGTRKRIDSKLELFPVIATRLIKPRGRKRK